LLAARPFCPFTFSVVIAMCRLLFSREYRTVLALLTIFENTIEPLVSWCVRAALVVCLVLSFKKEGVRTVEAAAACVPAL
jgi:hypothetical protein